MEHRLVWCSDLGAATTAAAVRSAHQQYLTCGLDGGLLRAWPGDRRGTGRGRTSMQKLRGCSLGDTSPHSSYNSQRSDCMSLNRCFPSVQEVLPPPAPPHSTSSDMATYHPRASALRCPGQGHPHHGRQCSPLQWRHPRQLITGCHHLAQGGRTAGPGQATAR